jgi:hypothetical protein
VGWEPPWKKLVEDLKDTGFESPYLDRLQAKLDVYQQRATLEKEILEEMAYSLGRAEDKVNVALELADREVGQATDPERRAEWVHEYNRRRAHARAMRRELIIHREALGMYRHELVHRFYPIPPAKDP